MNQPAETTDHSLPEDPLQLQSFGRLELVAEQLVEGLMIGRHRSPYKGSSVEFVEHRQYHPGDEIRHIDWRAYGKTGRYYVKEFEDETNLRCYIVIDASGSMSYAGKYLSKFNYARYLAASLAWLLLRQRDAAGLITLDTKLREQLQPSTSHDTFHRITQTLESTSPGGETSLASVIEQLLPRLKRRSMLVLISDCLDSYDSLEAAFRRLRHARHELAVFRIAAPEEEDFPFQHPTQFRSLEQPAHKLLVDPSRLRQEYLRQYAEFSKQLTEITGSMGIDYRRILTSTPCQAAIGEWLAERMSRKGHGR